jgi:hypothetical protein
MTFQLGTPITLINRSVTGVSPLGNDALGTAVTTVVLGGFAPGGSTELVQGQDQIITQPTVYLPAGTNVTAIDRIVVAGQTFEVDGSPNPYCNPFTGWRTPVEVKLKVVTG